MRRRQFLAAAASALAAPAVAQPDRARVLRFVPQADLAVLDPIFTPAPTTGTHGYYVFDTLYSTAADGVARPQMAAGHTVSDDGRTWRIPLREGLFFHDGTPVLAADCAASLQRWAKRDPFGSILARAVDSWGHADDRTVEIKLRRPFPLLLEAIGKADSQVAFIMPARIAATPADRAITEMVGSGPYRFVANEYRSGSNVVYEKFARYVPRSEPADWATGGKVVHYDRVEWHVIPDPATASAALERGEIDWWEQPLADLLPRLARNKDIVLQVANPQGRMAQITLNHMQKPFNDVRVRRAVLTAVNQDDFLRGTFGDDTSLWRPCPSMFPCGTPYETLDHGDLMKGDVAAAQAQLKASGYKGESTVVMNPTDVAVTKPLGEVAADLLKRIGMNVDLQETDWGTVAQRRSNHAPVGQGGWSLFCTSGSATNLATPATSVLVRGSGPDGWFGGWSDQQAVDLTQAWLDAPDQAERKRLASALAVLAMSQVATIPLGQFFDKTAFRRSITGVPQGVSPYPWGVRPA
jgi:peptide/nickel transport system substrate-binding protein